MNKVRTIDTHTHICTLETAAMISKAGAKVTIMPDDAENAAFDVAGVLYRPFPTGGFDIARRLKDMDAAGVDVHVLSATPQTYLYNQDAALTAVTAAIQNDQMAKHIAAHPTRFMGIATLPMQAPEEATDELKRAMSKLGLRGAMIGSHVYEKNLDDPKFEPLWATAEELGAFMFIHPVNVAGADRLKSYYLGNLIGNPLDTTIAAACLYFGGVMDRIQIEDHAGAWRRLHALSGSALGARLEGAPRAKEEHQGAAEKHRLALHVRHHPAFWQNAGVDDRLGRQRPRAARQRLSLRHGHARLRRARALALDLRSR